MKYLILIHVAYVGLITLCCVGCNQTQNKPEETYYRKAVPCEVVKNFEICCGAFADRYILTEHNRYKVSDRDNVVIGDSVCTYEWSTDKSYTMKSIKNKDISLYE